jgi:tRNA dimethylallyltransferase
MSQARDYSAAILIAGPTASGKSALALKLAKERNGVVINADSMQVYADLSLLTARPSDEDLHQAPHSMYGFVAATDAYSVGRWLVDAALAISTARQHGQTPIIVGGTGLYFLALLEGLSPVPEIPADIRRYWREAATASGGLHGPITQRLAAPAGYTRARCRIDRTVRRIAAARRITFPRQSAVRFNDGGRCA